MPQWQVYKGVRGGVQEVAVKQLRNAGAADLDKFVEEVALLKGLSYDRNIVQFYGVCPQPDGNAPLLVLEYMAGGDLCQALPEDDRLAWYHLGHKLAMDVARALHFLHSHEVVHSDLKTSNILLTKERDCAKVADVGLARVLDNATHMSNVMEWTLAYASPETILGQQVSPASDIFSLGVVLQEVTHLQEMVTRETPVSRGRLATPQAPRDCPSDIIQLINDCTVFHPGERPTAREVFRRLHASCAAHIKGFESVGEALALPDTSSDGCSLSLDKAAEELDSAASSHRAAYFSGLESGTADVGPEAVARAAAAAAAFAHLDGERRALPEINVGDD